MDQEFIGTTVARRTIEAKIWRHIYADLVVIYNWQLTPLCKSCDKSRVIYVYATDYKRNDGWFSLSAQHGQVPTLTSQNLKIELKILNHGWNHKSSVSTCIQSSLTHQLLGNWILDSILCTIVLFTRQKGHIREVGVGLWLTIQQGSVPERAHGRAERKSLREGLAFNRPASFRLQLGQVLLNT
jgi:hypothetical protein